MHPMGPIGGAIWTTNCISMGHAAIRATIYSAPWHLGFNGSGVAGPWDPRGLSPGPAFQFNWSEDSNVRLAAALPRKLFLS